jgi:hypothetical protein
VAIAATAGSVELFVNLDNATLTTASSGFIAAASAAPGWRSECWPGRFVAPAITLDQLIERHGEPIFIKMDVEGFEAEALAGLSRPLQAFSFEFTTILRRVAIDCLTRCRALGAYEYNAALGESQRLAFTHGSMPTRSADGSRRCRTALILVTFTRACRHPRSSRDLYAGCGAVY